MSKRNWQLDASAGGLIVLAIGLLCYGVSNETREQTYADAERRCAAEQSIRAERDISLAEGEKAAPSDDAASQEKAGGNHDPNWCDLAAQESVANSTVHLKWAAWLSLIASGVGLFMLGGTLHFTGRAADAALAAVHTERAWISFLGTEHTQMVDGWFNGVPYDTGLSIVAKWKNSGRSPALTVRCYLCVEMIEYGGDPRAFELPGNASSAGVIGPSGEFTSHQHVIIGDDLIALNDLKSEVIIYSRVSYFDVFNPSAVRHTEACTILGYRGEKRGRDGFVEKAYTARVAGPQNTAS